MENKRWDTTRLSAGERCALKRCAGQMLGQDCRALPAFYHALNDYSGKNEPYMFAAMCMECMWRPEDHPRVIPMEELLRKYYQNSDSTESIRHRMLAMMNVRWGNDGFLLGKICHLVRLMRSKDASEIPDFEKLADDMRRWNNSDRYVQQRWLRTIMEPDREEKKEEEENVD